MSPPKTCMCGRLFLLIHALTKSSSQVTSIDGEIVSPKARNKEDPEEGVRDTPLKCTVHSYQRNMQNCNPPPTLPLPHPNLRKQNHHSDPPLNISRSENTLSGTLAQHTFFRVEVWTTRGICVAISVTIKTEN